MQTIEFKTIIRNQQEVVNYLFKLQKLGLSYNYKLKPKRFPILIWWEDKKKVRFKYMTKKKVYMLYSDQPQAGKSTVAQCLKENGFEVITFAERIRSMLFSLLKGLMSDEEIYEGLYIDKDKMTPFGKTFRYLLQTLGTDWGRNMVNPDIWYMATYPKIKATSKNVVIDDMRFKNEYENPKKDFDVVYIRLFGKDNNIKETHESEGNLNEEFYHFSLKNNGTKEELRKKVEKLIST